jgi:hypothetical protein
VCCLGTARDPRPRSPLKRHSTDNTCPPPSPHPVFQKGATLESRNPGDRFLTRRRPARAPFFFRREEESRLSSELRNDEDKVHSETREADSKIRRLTHEIDQVLHPWTHHSCTSAQNARHCSARHRFRPALPTGASANVKIRDIPSV